MQETNPCEHGAADSCCPKSGLSCFVSVTRDPLGLLQPYMCLRYVRTRIPTTKADVYSFGVVLLEVATGWPALANGKHILEKV